ncbi:MAG TPA: hypothetical protein C5S50_03665 [Methanosarcinaceae archaeon]|nr:hypothetical protein [Methanosarcinaceae archaeon]
MNHIAQAPIDPASAQCAPCEVALVLDAGTQYTLLFLVLAIGLSLAYLYFKITFTLNKTNTTLEEISDLFDTLK